MNITEDDPSFFGTLDELAASHEPVKLYLNKALPDNLTNPIYTALAGALPDTLMTPNQAKALFRDGIELVVAAENLFTTAAHEKDGRKAARLLESSVKVEDKGMAIVYAILSATVIVPN